MSSHSRQPKNSFRYLGSVMHGSEMTEDDVTHVVLSDHESARKQDGSAELRMLRWICDKTMLDMILNGVFRAKLEVENIIYKMREGRLRWFGHVQRRPQSAPLRSIEALIVKGLRRMGRSKLRWEDKLKQDMKELIFSEDMTSDWNA
uniref:Polyprotein, putative n=1 Tax=Tanacetum cinerariifolium TaxID=118510 RepID=A0A699IGP8_TANCI|nr:polyprotein, putative [Tanacetum cinerariifolium]